MQGLVSIPEFVDYLQKNGLVIARAQDVVGEAEAAEAVQNIKLERLRERLLKKPWLTLHEILQLSLLNVTTKQALRYWIDTGTIRNNEHKTDSKNRIVVLTSAVKRLAYADDKN